jgi:hypothetical protein
MRLEKTAVRDSSSSHSAAAKNSAAVRAVTPWGRIFSEVARFPRHDRHRASAPAGLSSLPHGVRAVRLVAGVPMAFCPGLVSLAHLRQDN